MTQRVSCRRCGAHRDLALAEKCLVCGTESADPVSPTGGDVDAITAEVVQCAEDVDVAVHDGVALTAGHPIVARLRAACRARALALAGVLTR